MTSATIGIILNSDDDGGEEEDCTCWNPAVNVELSEEAAPIATNNALDDTLISDNLYVDED